MSFKRLKFSILLTYQGTIFMTEYQDMNQSSAEMVL